MDASWCSLSERSFLFRLTELGVDYLKEAATLALRYQTIFKEKTIVSNSFQLLEIDRGKNFESDCYIVRRILLFLCFHSTKKGSFFFKRPLK